MLCEQGHDLQDFNLFFLSCSFSVSAFYTGYEIWCTLPLLPRIFIGKRRGIKSNDDFLVDRRKKLRKPREIRRVRGTAMRLLFWPYPYRRTYPTHTHAREANGAIAALNMGMRALLINRDIAPEDVWGRNCVRTEDRCTSSWARYPAGSNIPLA